MVAKDKSAAGQNDLCVGTVAASAILRGTADMDNPRNTLQKKTD
jgi:hypothetical protein